MFGKSTLLKGTFILTSASLITRILGFFYRIFISRIFTAEEIGLYQLIFPIYSLGFSLSAAGIQTALSRSTARYIACNQKGKAIQALKITLSTSFLLSFLYILLVQNNLVFICTELLGDSRCSFLLLIIMYALPFASIHSGICGFYMGQRHTKCIAISQLIEQTSRILLILLLYLVSLQSQTDFSITYASIGIVFGELMACIYTIYQTRQELFFPKTKSYFNMSTFSDLMTQTLPLTLNRVSINFIQSVETILIPVRLQLFGYSSSEALGLYGIFSGMALPCILFPSALTNALSAMLLPTIAEYQISKKKKDLWSYICKIAISCFLMGTACFLFFFFTGTYIGTLLFDNMEAGTFIVSLSFLCPFLYMNTTLLTTLNGMGKTFSSFMINILSLIIRILCVYFLVPVYGISAYMLGLFSSQILISLLSLGKIYSLLSN